ncbi:Small ubiquitin-related modifier 2 -like protein [Gossypium arboreum]|uniref:Small ubiquitin-related modifier 2-like protein n=1 Tax=Gossypium arboreum TaxID=29729 RepID=A0A0B0MV05_GOSAR|nr:Small ubiquitin-related modifier 2 -like protein [Gossypium arboreum]
MPRSAAASSSGGDDKALTTADGQSQIIQDGNKVVYNIKRHAKLIKLMHAYCRKKQLDIHTVRFIYEGHRVPGKYTSDQLNLEDGAEICCMFHQSGGGVCSMPKITSAFI